MDQIVIKDLEVFAHHGVMPEENKLGQKFVVSAVMYGDFYKAGQSDHLSETVDYGKISHEIQSFLQLNTFQLIEAAAHQLALHLLRNNVLLNKLQIEIKKPWAPILLPMQYASVIVERGWHTAYIALGSNMGDKQAYLEQAVKEIRDDKDCMVERISDWIETKPYGNVEQDPFLNGVIKIKTLLEPQGLLELLHTIEDKYGRTRTIHWGPRTLDLDILMYDHKIVDTEELTIPHTDMHNRDFVLEPMYQIAPYEVHPVLQKSITVLLHELQKKK